MDVFRKEYRELSAEEKEKIERVKTKGASLMLELQQDHSTMGADGRYLALARTALEESVMWATKALTG